MQNDIKAFKVHNKANGYFYGIAYGQSELGAYIEYLRSNGYTGPKPSKISSGLVLTEVE